MWNSYFIDVFTFSNCAFLVISKTVKHQWNAWLIAQVTQFTQSNGLNCFTPASAICWLGQYKLRSNSETILKMLHNPGSWKTLNQNFDHFHLRVVQHVICKSLHFSECAYMCVHDRAIAWQRKHSLLTLGLFLIMLVVKLTTLHYIVSVNNSLILYKQGGAKLHLFG